MTLTITGRSHYITAQFVTVGVVRFKSVRKKLKNLWHSIMAPVKLDMPP